MSECEYQITASVIAHTPPFDICKIKLMIFPFDIGRCFINTSVGHLEITVITLFIKVTCIYLETTFH